jgi:glutathione S-transferase
VKLYYFIVAPNPTRVRLYLAEKGIEIEQVLVNLREGEHKSPEHLARNRFGKLPVLELDDGSYLTESAAIMEYLDELHPDPPLLGRTPEERARGRDRHRICDVGVLMNIGRAVHATNSPMGLPPCPEVAESARETMVPALEFLDERLAAHAFVDGARPGMADCTLFAGLGFGQVFGVTPEGSYPNIDRWRGDFAQRESVKSL